MTFFTLLWSTITLLSNGNCNGKLLSTYISNFTVILPYNKNMLVPILTRTILVRLTLPVTKKVIFTPKLGRSVEEEHGIVDFTPRLGRRLAEETGLIRHYDK